MAPEKRSWSELSTRSKVGIVVASVFELIVTSIALRDLKDRPAETVRGPKFLWALVCMVQPVGPIAYLLVGRRGEQR